MADDPWAEFNPVTPGVPSSPLAGAYAGIEGQQPLGPEYFTPLVRSPMPGHIFMSRIGEGNLGGSLLTYRDERFRPYDDYRANVPYSFEEPGFGGPEIGGPQFVQPRSYGISVAEDLTGAIKPFDRNQLLGNPAFDSKALSNWLKTSGR